MSKSRKRIADNPDQLTIFDLITAKSQEKNEFGSLRVVDELKAALTNALKSSPLSRHQVAGEMSHTLSVEITKGQIAAWTANSKSARHIPAEYLPAFCRVTQSIEPIEVLGRKAGFFVLAGPEALKGEIHELKDEAKKLREEISKRESVLKLYESPTDGQ